MSPSTDIPTPTPFSTKPCRPHSCVCSAGRRRPPVTPLLLASECPCFENKVGKPPPVSTPNSGFPKPSSVSKFSPPSRPSWAGGDDVSAVTLQKGVFIQFDCYYYVVAHSINVVIYEMCVAMVVYSFSFFLLPPPSLLLFLLFFFLLCHLSGRKKPGLIISWHILCSLQNVSCRPVRKLLLGLGSPSFYFLPQSPLYAGRGPAPSCMLAIRGRLDAAGRGAWPPVWPSASHAPQRLGVQRSVSS